MTDTTPTKRKSDEDENTIDLPLTQKAATLGVQAAMNASAAGDVVKGGVYATVGRFGTAGTGVPIAPLVGIAKNDSILARIGSGAIANGGGGKLLGTIRLENIAKATTIGVIGGVAITVVTLGILEYKAAVAAREAEARVAEAADMSPVE